MSPVKKTEFNFCKSHIKTMECAAIGVPLFATNCLPYSRVMEKNFLYDTGDELKDKLVKFKYQSAGAYGKTIESNWRWLNAPCHEGDFNLKNYWLEDNLPNVWVPLFRLPQKGFKISYTSFSKQYEKRKEDEAKRLVFKSKSGKARITL